MANSSRENSPKDPNSPKNDAGNDDVVPVTSSVTAPATVPAPVQVPGPLRALQFGEGSSSVPVVQELLGGLSSTSSSSSSSPGATPPRRAVQIVLGGTGEGSARKRRALPPSGKKDEVTQGEEKKRKKGEMDAPTSEPICSICGKRFGSWKGVFGHLRAHPERDWRGAFPPPKGQPGSWSPIKLSGPDDHQALQVQLLAPTLLDLARETLAKMREESTASASTRVARFDLNREPGSSSSSASPPPPQGGASGSGSGGLDLNKPPPPEKDEGDHGNE